MRAVLLLSVVCLAGYAIPSVAQKPAAKSKPASHTTAAPATPAAPAAITLADVAGNWTTENSVKTATGQDTVVKSVLVANASGKWVMHIAGRDPIPAHVITVGGDSVVAESAPFASVTRPGQTVTTRETLHFKGDTFSGTIEAKYSNGQSMTGTTKGTRKK
ncbi:MAG TPA: hypothetical protein VG454_09760 [Gemmatimonadales bacterium]|nr:hypothetical protein [Gemmatimonadales bacterium]